VAETLTHELVDNLSDSQAGKLPTAGELTHTGELPTAGAEHGVRGH
jgi:hypothetical protein